MTRNELPSHIAGGRVDRIDIARMANAKWLLVSEKPGDIATKVYESEAEAIQAYEEIKQERGL